VPPTLRAFVVNKTAAKVFFQTFLQQERLRAQVGETDYIIFSFFVCPFVFGISVSVRSGT
jgi:hypothetical protein